VLRHVEAIATVHKAYVLFLTPLEDEREEERIVRYTEAGVHVTIVYYRKKWSAVGARLRALKMGKKALEENHPISFNLIHHHVTWPEGWLGAWLSFSYKIPLVVTEHWTGYLSDQRGPLPFRIRSFSRWLAGRATCLMPVTENLARHMRHLGMSGKYQVVPNVVDTSIFTIGDKPSGCVHFLHVSSLVESHKNISGLLRSWKKASDANPDIHLTIGGDGPWQEIRKAAFSLGISDDRIDFFGEESPSQIAQRMSEAHVLLLFSNYENLPCVIVEALASGMRVISTRVGGIAEHINDNRGTLVPIRDEHALYSAILSEAECSARVDKNALRQYALDQFSIPAIADAFDHVYQSVIAAHTK